MMAQVPTQALYCAKTLWCHNSVKRLVELVDGQEKLRLFPVVRSIALAEISNGVIGNLGSKELVESSLATPETLGLQSKEF